VTVSGQVLGEDGFPVAGVRVRIYPAPEDPLKTVAPLRTVAPLKTVAPYRTLAVIDAREAVTDASGQYRMVGLAGGPLAVLAEQGDRLKAFARIEVGDGDHAGVSLRLQPTGAIRGVVSAPDQPLVNDFTRVEVFVPGLPYVVRPAENGTFLITGLPVGDHVLRAYREGLGEAGRGQVRVQPGGVTDVGAMVLTRRVPRLTRLDPPYVPEGGVLRLVGENLGIQTGDPFQVFVDGKVVRGARAIDAATIEVPVTPGVASGKVFVTVGSLESNELPFHKIVELAIGVPEGALALSLGQTHRIPTAIGIPDDGEEPVSLSVGPVWSVAGSAATLDSDRVLEAVRVGDAELSLSWGGLRATRNIRVYPSGSWTPSALVGQHTLEGDDDGPADRALLRAPSQLVFDARGRLILADEAPSEDGEAFDPGPEANRLRILDDGVLRPWSVHLPGGEPFSFVQPRGMALAPDGGVVVADAGLQRIYRVSADGEVTLVAGSGDEGFADGPALAASFSNPWAIAVAPDGRIAVSDLGNHRIRLIVDGTVSTLAGTGHDALVDGPVGTGSLHQPYGLAWAPDGVLWSSDVGGNCLRTIDPAGFVRTVSRKVGLLDGPQLDALFASPTAEGPLAEVDFRWPYGIRFDREGALWVCDWQSTQIRRVKDGLVSTVRRRDRELVEGLPFQGITGNYAIDFDPDGHAVVNNVWWHTVVRLQ
jgi:sugar lactone lactonase YvrE